MQQPTHIKTVMNRPKQFIENNKTNLAITFSSKTFRFLLYLQKYSIFKTFTKQISV